MLRVNVGCGRWPLAGFVNLDADPSTPADLHVTVPPLPYPDGAVEDLYLGHVLEHLEPAAGMALLRECYRALKVGGRIGVVVPDTREVCRRYLAGQLPLNQACAEFFYSTVQPSHHLWSYDLDTLGAALVQAGFSELTPIDRFHDPRISYHVWYGCGWDARKGAA